jgi:hypothetical protein
MKNIFSKKQAGRILANHLNLLIMLIMVQTFTACTDDTLQDSAQPDGGRIAFDLAIGGSVQTRVSTAADFSSAWEQGDAVGLFAVSHASGTPAALAASGNYMNNVSLALGASVWSLSPAQYYPADGNQLDFYAYYPRQTTVANATGMTFTVQTDQSAGTNFNKSDLLLAKQMNVAKSASPVPLAFSHALSLVQVQVTNATATTTVTLLNVKTSVTIDWTASTPAVTASGTAGNIKMARVSGTNLFRALVSAQDIPAGSGMFMVSGSPSPYLSAPLSGNLTLVQGGVYKFATSI